LTVWVKLRAVLLCIGITTLDVCAYMHRAF
jgi:hypothetical protein